MDDPDYEALVRRVLADVAPDVDAAGVDPHADVRDELGLDSMDLLNLAVALHEETGIEVPERDYARIVTVAGCAEYLREHAG